MALLGSGVATRSTCCAPHPTRCNCVNQSVMITKPVVSSGLWRASAVRLIVPCLLALQAINFASYDAYKLLLQGNDAELGRFKSFVAGALAGECNTMSSRRCFVAHLCPELCYCASYARGPASVRQAAGHSQSITFASAGVTACITCFPLDLLRTRILADRTRQAGVIETLRLILRTEGPAALYSGCLPAVISVAPSNAVFFGVYDLLKVLTGPT